MMVSAIASCALGVWIYLIVGHGGCWRLAERDETAEPPAQRVSWPDVAAVVPARNEANMAPRSIASLIAQDYPGRFVIVVVDDNSDDGTAGAVRAASAEAV